MYMTNTYMKATLLALMLTILVFALGGCGNTVKGIGTDIVKMGENLMDEKKELKNEN